MVLDLLSGLMQINSVVQRGVFSSHESIGNKFPAGKGRVRDNAGSTEMREKNDGNN